MDMRVILIRHGLTNDNLKKRYCGFKDIGINKFGREQAVKIKNRLKKIKIDNVFCSDLKRSWQTAGIIFADSGYKIVKRPNLRELNFGDWEGLSFKRVLEEFPSLYRKWLKDPFSINIPKAEKTIHFITRVKKEFINIVKSHPSKTVAIVSHIGPIRVMLNTSLCIKKKDFWRLKIEPQDIYIIEYKCKGFLKPKIYKL